MAVSERLYFAKLFAHKPSSSEHIPSPFSNTRNVVIKQPIGDYPVLHPPFDTKNMSRRRVRWQSESFAGKSHNLITRSILTPWNFPSAMITRKLGATLAAGCTTVIKPPSETPFSALALAEVRPVFWCRTLVFISVQIVQLGRRAGVPDGVINVVTTEKNINDVSKEMCESEVVKKVTFTGSTRVAKLLYKMAASTIKKYAPIWQLLSQVMKNVFSGFPSKRGGMLHSSSLKTRILTRLLKVGYLIMTESR